MGKSKFTHGPLYVVRNDLIGGWAVCTEDAKYASLKPVSDLTTADLIGSPHDAALYAAAPDMHEIIEDMLNQNAYLEGLHDRAQDLLDRIERAWREMDEAQDKD